MVHIAMEKNHFWIKLHICIMYIWVPHWKYSRFRTEINIYYGYCGKIQLDWNYKLSHVINLHYKRFIFLNEISFITFYGPSKANSIFIIVMWSILSFGYTQFNVCRQWYFLIVNSLTTLFNYQKVSGTLFVANIHLTFA